MANFAASASLAAMSQRAHQILSGASQVATPGGLQSIPSPAAPAIPQSFLANRQDQLGGGVSGINQSLLAALRATPQSFTPAALAAKNAALQQAAILRQQQWAATQPGGSDYGFQSMGDFSRGNAGAAAGIVGSDEAILAAANRYAAGRSYGGGAYAPHAIMQEGTVTYQNGVPGIMIKYDTPGGSSTEWTPLQ